MDQKLLDQIYKLIGENVGYSIVDSYKKFYQYKPDEVIIISVEELLSDLIGPQAAADKLSTIKQALKIHKV